MRPDPGVEPWCAYGQARRTHHRPCADPRVVDQNGVDQGAHLALPDSAHQTLLVYILDVYDPWSYAYLPSVRQVFTEAKALAGAELVHSGRYAGRDVSDLAEPAAEVAASTPTRFGSGFVDLVRRGGRLLDAELTAAGVIGLLAAGDLPVAHVLQAVQDAFFLDGQLLHDAGVLQTIGDGLGLDGHAVEVFAHSPRAHELAAEDFAMAGDFDRSGGPMLLASHDGRVYEFDGRGATGDRLVDQFRSVLARP